MDQPLSRAILHAVLLAWPVWAALVGILTASAFVGLRRRSRLLRSGFREIDEMPGRMFEQYLELLFRKLGYEVERTRFTGDYGGDLVLRRDDVRTIVQAKRQGRPVGIKAVQEVAAARAYYDCAEAIVVSNRPYTQPARDLAEKNGVALWDRDTLARLHARG